MTELTETEHRIEDGEMRHVTDSENDWTKRIHISYRDKEVDATCGAGIINARN